MATVKEVKNILSFSAPSVSPADHGRYLVHVLGFIAATDLKVLVRKYHVYIHSDGFLCVE